jgi:hypothetical protein
MSVPDDYPGIAVRFSGDMRTAWQPVVAHEPMCVVMGSAAVRRAWQAYARAINAATAGEIVRAHREFQDAIAVGSEWIMD